MGGYARPGLDVLFNSLQFAAFFAIVVIVFFATPHRTRWLVLLAASLVFYAAGRADHLLLLIASATIAYTGARAIEAARDPVAKRRSLTATIVAELAILCTFKYTAFAARTVNDAAALVGLSSAVPVPELALPIGISFFTFQGISYVVDVYRGIPATKNPLTFLLYKTFFPQLVAGPIERARSLLPQLRQPVSADYARMVSGMQLMAWGFFKKLVVADNLATYVDPVFERPEVYAGASLYLAALFFTYQIYCDFSGYTDIATGVAEVFGVRLTENFRRPLHATSTAELWRRWHMTLMSWFFDYVYVPLTAGKRDASSRRRALFAVFFLSGLWHGASWTFVVWGLLQGVLVVGGELTRPARERIRSFIGVEEEAIRLRVFRTLVTLHLAVASFVFFRARTIEDALTVFARMPLWFEPAQEVTLAPGEFAVLVGALVILELVQLAQARGPLRPRIASQPAFVRWSLYVGLVTVILVFGRFAENTFLYFNF